MRTTKKERKENAMNFYNTFMNGNGKNIAIVVNRKGDKCQFQAVISSMLAGSPIVNAESSVFGIEGCFIELLKNIKPGVQKTYNENGFNEWMYEKYGFRITYKDGFVIMLEK